LPRWNTTKSDDDVYKEGWNNTTTNNTGSSPWSLFLTFSYPSSFSSLFHDGEEGDNSSRFARFALLLLYCFAFMFCARLFLGRRSVFGKSKTRILKSSFCFVLVFITGHVLFFRRRWVEIFLFCVGPSCTMVNISPLPIVLDVLFTFGFCVLFLLSFDLYSVSIVAFCVFLFFLSLVYNRESLERMRFSWSSFSLSPGKETDQRRRKIYFGQFNSLKIVFALFAHSLPVSTLFFFFFQLFPIPFFVNC
jgi:hypothetical protein